MHARTMRLALTGVLLLVTTMLLTAQERDRAKVPDSFKWNLADVYPDQAAWRARKDGNRGRNCRRCGSWKGSSAPRRRSSPTPSS